MAENAIRRARAPVTPFDPAAWLTRFRDVGGWWLIGCDDRAYIGVRIQHTTEAQQRRALQMFEQAHTSPAIGAALSAHLAQAAGVLMSDRNPPAEPASRTATGANVVALPRAAVSPVRQPRGGAIGAYRKAHPWPGQWHDPVPADDGQAQAFAIACAEVEAARGFADWTAAQLTLAHLTHAQTSDQAEVRYAHWRALDEYREAIAGLAHTPTPDRRALARKVDAIGQVWLGAAGNWYDGLRAGVAADAARLGVSVPAARRR